MDTGKRITKNSAKAGKQKGLTTNSLSKIAFGSTSSRDLIIASPPFTKRDQSERQLAVAKVDHTKEHVNSTDSTPLSEDESFAKVEGALFDNDTKDTKVDKESAPASEGIHKTQLTEIRAVVKMTNTNKNMIAPGTRDAPKFLARRPEELRRFKKSQSANMLTMTAKRNGPHLIPMWTHTPGKNLKRSCLQIIQRPRQLREAHRNESEKFVKINEKLY